ncbi:MAG: Holliday junction resolvase-like protein [Parcubacteria group bacterium Gr01-1014_8]|nr:MAG: Holliday junction resolvase-like protein [Parcubacteria group bacterium Gr01-1014_8]
MRYLGIDYGTKGVGLAISDESAQFAFPFAVFPNDQKLLENILDVIHDMNIAQIIVGDTRAEGGASNRITEEAEQFMSDLAGAINLQVHRVREAWSSVEASRFAPKGKERDDAAAAAIILQRFLDVHKAV